MRALTITTWAASTLLHASVVLAFVDLRYGNPSYDVGPGDDMLRVEQGVAIEGLGFGDAIQHIETAEVMPVQKAEALPPVEEIKAEEKTEEVQKTPEPEIKETLVSSASGQPQEVDAREWQEEVKPTPPPPQQVAAVEQAAQVAMVAEQSSAAEQKGGQSSTQFTQYLGSLRTSLEKSKINPRSKLAGTVVVKFALDEGGQLLSKEIVSSSGSAVLDQAAIDSIDRAAPFPPVPRGVSKGPLVVSVPFKFSVR